MFSVVVLRVFNPLQHKEMSSDSCLATPIVVGVPYVAGSAPNMIVPLPM